MQRLRRSPLTEQLPLSGSGDTDPAQDHGAHTDMTERSHSPRPFGTRFATTPPASHPDLSTFRYDAEQQIGLMFVDGSWRPLLDPRLGLTLHTTGSIPTEDEVHDKDDKY